MIFDKETEAISKCVSILKELDKDAKIRVTKYFVDRFGNTSAPTYNSDKAESAYSNHQDSNNESLLDIDNCVEGVDGIGLISEAPIDEYPTLNDLLVKNHPKTEPEWVLCYAFYASKYGNKTFRKDEIIQKYKENGRLTTNTSGNLTNNINSCLKRNWFKSLNNNEFLLKPEGVLYAQEVITGRVTSKEAKPEKRKFNTLK